MNNPEEKTGVFTLGWLTGSVEINVENFFLNADAKQMRQFIKLCRQYGTEEQRLKLLGVLVAEDNRRKKLQDEISELRQKQQKLLAEFFHFDVSSYKPEMPLSQNEKLLNQQRKRIQSGIDKVKEGAWR